MSLLQVGGFALASAAVWAFAAGHIVLGAVLGVLAVAAFAAAESTAAAPRPEPSPLTASDAIVTLAVLAVAVLIRVHRIREIPWGINNDVAWNGLYALRILAGQVPYTPYTDEAWGKETFFFYLVAGVFRVFGAGEITLLLPSIVAGALTVAAFYLASRLLFDRPTATMAACLLAALAWHVTLSRTGYRAILAPLLLVVTLGCFFRAIDAATVRGRFAWFAAAGAALGLGHHSYFSFRVATPLLVLLALREAWTGQGFVRRCAGGLALMLAIAALFVLPLAVYAIQHPDVFFARTGHLWIGNRMREAGSWAPFWENLRANLLLFHHRADAEFWNFFNREWPILSRPLGLVLLAGLGVLLGRWRRRGPFVAIAVAFFAHLPSVLSAPDATRSLLVTLAVAWAAAAGVDAAARVVSGGASRGRWLAAAVLTAGLMAAELHFYFERLGRDPAAQFGYAGLHTAIGRTVRDLARGHITFVSSGHTFTTTEFLWRDVPPGRIVSGGIDSPELVAPEQLRAPLEEAMAAPRPPGLGLAFVIEAHPANEPLLQRVREAFPGAVERAHDDERYGAPAYFSFVSAGQAEPERD